MTISDKELEDIGYIENPTEIIVEEETKLVSVSEALRSHIGKYRVSG